MRLLTIVGNRPQFIKGWVLSRAARAAGVEEVVLHTGQHYDAELSSVFFEELELLEPAYRLDCGSGTLAEQLAAMLPGIDRAIRETGPDWVVVFGDTNSTLAGALAARSAETPLAHVEAGMRSDDFSMPEEANRILSDRLSQALFCPSPLAVANLAHEGIRDGVLEVGDIMRDVANLVKPLARERSNALAEHSVEPGGYVLLTVHRQANAAPEPLGCIAAAIRELDLPTVFPVHPRTRQIVDAAGIEFGANAQLVAPLGLLDFRALLLGARTVLTDSGGIQKEAYWHGVPCVTLRDTTEWPETIDAGWNQLVGTGPDAIVRATAAASSSPAPEQAARTLYGDGRAAEAIVRELGTMSSR